MGERLGFVFGGFRGPGRVARRVAAGILTGFLVISAGALVPVATGAGAAPRGDVSSGLVRGLVLGAEGSFVTAQGVTVQTGLVAPLTMACVNEQDALHREVATFNLALPNGGPSLASLNTMVGDIVALRDTASVTVKESETIESVNLLGGLVTATGVQARVTSVLDGSGVHHVFGSEDTGTTIADLVVAGVQLGPIEPAPNTVIAIPLVGRLVLNEQSFRTDGMKVTAMHLYVDNYVGAVGDLSVAAAQTRIRDVRAQLGAEAYSARIAANVPTLGVDTGKLVQVALGCGGSLGVPETITALGIDQGALLQTGTATNTVNGITNPLATFTEASSVTQSINFGEGLITAEAVTAYARTELVGTDLVNSGSSTFANLVIGGQAIDVSVPPNTRINLPELGYVLLNGQVPTLDPHVATMRTRAIEVVIQVAPNSLDLPVGARVIVAEGNTTVRY